MRNFLFYIFMVISALITAFSQILLKKSADKTYKNVIFEYFNPYVLCSYGCYIGVLVLNVFIYTKVDYRFGVVINSLSTVFVMLLSHLVLKERVTGRRIVGNILIACGILAFMLL